MGEAFPSVSAPLSDRSEAGQLLATRLQAYARHPQTLVLGLPRGGVPVAYEIARALHLPLDVWLVRKLGVPGHAEFAMGAIASQQVRVLHHDVIQRLSIPRHAVVEITRREAKELYRRERLYRQGRLPLVLTGKTVILVDDGAATGATLQAAIQALQSQRPARIVVALPVASEAAAEILEPLVDEVVCLIIPEQLNAISQWYHTFDQTSDDIVCTLLADSLSPENGKNSPPKVAD